jgi:hypothetical protein
MAFADWRLIPAGDIHTAGWSFGAVADVPSLYKPTTFGPKEDNRCDCGKYVGGEYDGIICDSCGVKICADAAAARNHRLGHIWLACWCQHPVTKELIEAFPVAAIATRTRPDGTPNALGRKYEALVELNRSMADALPPREAAHTYYPAAKKLDRSSLLAAMRDILIGTGINSPDQASILGLAYKALADGSPYVTELVRCYGYALRAEFTV